MEAWNLTERDAARALTGIDSPVDAITSHTMGVLVPVTTQMIDSLHTFPSDRHQLNPCQTTLYYHQFVPKPHIRSSDYNRSERACIRA